ncbi:MAG: methyltransferase domain-containing protein [Acidobacteriota bacterium]|nr:methyltransferase domain-containing protein [Acidobacteriota bacterium]
MTAGEEYRPAMGHGSRLEFYDPLIRITMRERRFKRRLLAEAGLHPGFRVLDLGCGTGTLAVMAKRAEPDAAVIGVDGDPTAIGLAHRKIARENVDVQLHLALVQELPYPDGSFDRVLSTLVLHHLSHNGKVAALREVVRVLAPGGEFHMADFGRPANWLARAGFGLVRKFDGMENTEDNARGLLEKMMAEVGLRDVRETASFATVFGTLRLYAARQGH